MKTLSNFTPGLVDPIHWKKMLKAPEMYELLQQIIEITQGTTWEDCFKSFAGEVIKIADKAEKLLAQINETKGE